MKIVFKSDKYIKKFGNIYLENDENFNINHKRFKESEIYILGTLHGTLNEILDTSSYDVKSFAKSALDSNGSFSVIIFNSKNIKVITDAGGSIPIYYGTGPNGFSLGHPVHIVAKKSGLQEWDYVSVTDYMINHVVCYPYTWYKGIKMVPPGSITTFFKDGKIDIHSYWEPVEPLNIYEECNVKEWAMELRETIQSGISDSIGAAQKIRLLYSGGEDSRALLGLMPKHKNCIPTTVLIGKNREYYLAKRSAALLGYQLDYIKRPDKFYRDNLLERVDITGPGMDLRNTHMSGVVAEYLKDADLIIGGLSSDSLYKPRLMSNVINGKYGFSQKLNIPDPDNIDVLKYSKDREKFFKNDLVSEVQSRRQKHHDKLKSIRPQTAGNWHALWPISNRNDFSQFITNIKIGPQAIEPFMFSKSYQLASSMPDFCRINRQVFNKAFCKEMGLAGWYPTSGSNIPRAQSTWINYLYRLGRKYRKKMFQFKYENGYQGSWHPDEGGWFPVNPKDHFDDERCVYLNNQLEQVLKDGDPVTFWNNPRNERFINAMKVRALALAFKTED